VEASSFIGAVLEAASLRSPAFIESEGMKTLRSGCLDEKTKALHQARSSAEREGVQARHAGKVGSAGSRRSQAEDSPLCAAVSVRKEEFRGQASCTPKQPIAGEPLKQSLCAGSGAGSRLGTSKKALPNPSIKPSPNSKAPGPRYSALSLVLQRGPGALPSVPAYVER
jgi:hypothetical protein